MSKPSQKPHATDAPLLNALNLTVGPHRIRKLLVRHGSAGAVWRLSAAGLAESGISGAALDGIRERRKNTDPEAEWERLQKAGIGAITLHDKRYPPLLKEIHSPPLLLYVRGKSEVLLNPALAIVGTRRYSSYGATVVERLVPYLTAAGLTIVSGLAQGIDALAHKQTLAARGTTIAVLGNGIDAIVPERNKKLGEEMLEGGGAIVSEYPWGVPPLKQHFPARNRIIAGLALGTLVIESRLPGGSLITAEHAMEQGREVFAVPGPITSPTAEGTNTLIKDGATPVHTAEDVLHSLKLPMGRHERSGARHELSETEQRIMEALEAEPLYIDAIIKHTELTPAETGARLTALELKGMVKNTGGNTYQRLV